MTKFLETTKMLFMGIEKDKDPDTHHITELMRLTRDELESIERNTQEVTDDDLLDYFMYCRLAAQQKYNYLIKQYRLADTSYKEKECM